MHKGAISDSFILLIILFVFIIVAMASLTLTAKFNEKFKLTAGINDTIAPNLTQSIQTKGFGTLDNMIPFLVVGANVMMLVFSFMVRTHPIFAIVVILFLLIMLVITAGFVNAYQSFASNVNIQDASNSMPFTKLVMDNLMLIQLLFGALDIIILFSSLSGGGGDQNSY